MTRRPKILGLDRDTVIMLAIFGTAVMVALIFAGCGLFSSETIESGKQIVKNTEETTEQVLQLLTDARVVLIAAVTFISMKGLGLIGRKGYEKFRNGKVKKP